MGADAGLSRRSSGDVAAKRFKNYLRAQDDMQKILVECIRIVVEEMSEIEDTAEHVLRIYYSPIVYSITR